MVTTTPGREIQVSGSVYIDSIQVGTVTGAIYDRDQFDYAVTGVKEYLIEVYVDTAGTGRGVLVFEDKYADPTAEGQRDVNLSGAVSIDGTQVGTITASFTDVYGQAPLPDVGFIEYTARILTQPGGTVSIEVTLQNQTSQDATVTITITDDQGNTVAEEQATVPAGGQQTVTLNAQAPATPGVYTWTITVNPA